MEEGLKVQVGLEVQDASKSLAQLEAEFKDLEKTISQTTDDKALIPLNKRLQELRETLNAIRNAGKVGFDDFGQKLKAVKPAADRAGQSLTDLSRIVQDLPYGFQGIGNNLNPLFESFTRLRKETGSTGSAFTALLGSLKGAGGIGLALSGISTAFSFLQMGMSAWTRGFGSAKKEVKEMSGYLGTTKDQLNQVNSKFAEEASRVTVLVNTLQKGKLSHEQIKSAKEELIRISPEYFSHLDKEGSKISDVTAAYVNYNNALVKSIENQIKIDKLTKAIDDRLKVEEKNPLGLKEFQKLAKAGKSVDDILHHIDVTTVNDIKKSLTAVSGQYSLIRNDGTLAFQEQAKAAAAVVKNNKDTEEQLKRVAAAYKAVDGILSTIDPQHVKPQKGQIEKITEYVRQGLIPVEIPLSLKEAKKKLGIELKEIFFGLQETTAKSFGDGTIFGEAATEGYRNFKIYWEKEAKKNPLYIEAPKIKLDGLNGQYEKFFTVAQKNAIAATEKIKQFNQEVTGILQQGAVNATAALGESIGNILAYGAKGMNAFAGIGAVLGDILIQLGKAAIATSIGIKAISQALKTMNPYVALAAGVGLVALGSLIKSKLGNITAPGAGMATGGIVPPGYPNDTFPARLSSNEAVIPLDRLDAILGSGQGGGTLTARISGNDLLLALERTQRSQRRSF